MKKFLLHIVSLIICLSFALQTNYALISSIEYDVEVERDEEAKYEEEKNRFFKKEECLTYDEPNANYLGNIINVQEVIDGYESTFFVNSQYKLHKLYNLYLI